MLGLLDQARRKPRSAIGTRIVVAVGIDVAAESAEGAPRRCQAWPALLIRRYRRLGDGDVGGSTTAYAGTPGVHAVPWMTYHGTATSLVMTEPSVLGGTAVVTWAGHSAQVL